MKAFALGLLLLSTPAFAATQAVLQLKGTVPQILEVSINSETAATSLPLELTQTNLKIGTATERSNSANGYKVTITSANLGKLVKDSDNEIAYTFMYGTFPVNLSGPYELSFPFMNAAPINRDLKISYTASNALVEGDYTDTITVTVAAN